MRVTTIVLLLIIIAGMALGQEAYGTGEYTNETIVEYAQATLVWDSTEYIAENEEQPIARAVVKMTDAMGFIFFEIAKYGVEFGFKNPEYNLELMVEIIKLYIYLTILSLMAPLILPMVALAYMIYQKGREIYDRQNKQ